MGSSPEQVRQEIEETRAVLSEHLDQLAERTSPRRVAHGRKQMLSRRVQGLRERVMGQAGDTSRRAQTAAGQTTDQARRGAGQAVDAAKAAPDQARRAAGNPLAVGLIAFGFGLLAAAVIPQSEYEQEAGKDLTERAQPIRDTAASTTRHLAQNAKETGQEATRHVKDTATEAGKETASQASTHARDVADQTRQSTHHSQE